MGIIFLATSTATRVSPFKWSSPRICDTRICCERLAVELSLPVLTTQSIPLGEPRSKAFETTVLRLNHRVDRLAVELPRTKQLRSRFNAQMFDFIGGHVGFIFFLIF